MYPFPHYHEKKTLGCQHIRSEYVLSRPVFSLQIVVHAQTKKTPFYPQLRRFRQNNYHQLQPSTKGVYEKSSIFLHGILTTTLRILELSNIALYTIDFYEGISQLELRTDILRLLEIIKKTVAFLGKLDEDGKPQPFATGFFVSLGGILHLVTAKHVIVDPENESPRDAGMLVFYNGKDGRIRSRSIDDLKRLNFTWVFHKKREVDIGILPFHYDPNNDDIEAVPDNFFFSDKLYEVYDVFFLSYQPGVKIEQKILPIIRGGTISLINEDNTFFIDGASFPGNMWQSSVS